MKPTPPLGSNPQDTASGPMHIDWIRWFESLKTAVENLSTQTYAPVTPSALTRANDTNVTVTLTGSPTVALLAPVLMTMGWTGVLAVSRGGTGTGTAFTAGSVIFAGPSGVYAQDNAHLFWDDTNNRLGIGTNAPTHDVDIVGTLNVGVFGTPSAIILTSAVAVIDTTRTRLDVNSDFGRLRLFDSTGATIVSFGGNQVGFVDTQRTGFGVQSPTAIVHLKAGTTAANTAPMKFNSGSLLTSPEAGAHEFLTDDLYLTITTGAARKGIVLNDGTALTATRVPFATTNGRLTDDSDMTFVTDTLTVTKIIASTSLTLSGFTSGSVVFAGASGLLSQDNTNFFWDNSNKRLGLGTASPAQVLDVSGAINAGRTGTAGAYTLTSSATNNQRWRVDTNADFGRIRVFNSADVVIVQLGGAVVNFVTAAAFGLSVTSPTAILHLKAGTTAASTAPLKFNSGSLMTTAEAGAVEFLTDDFYGTITTGAARKAFVLNDGTALTSGRVPFATTNGRLTDDSDLTFATDTLTATKLSAPTSVSTGTLAQTGKTTTYNNVATAGWGEPAIYGSARSTAQVAAVASVAAYTCGAADGSFIVSMNVNVTTSTTHNFTAECAYTDETNTARVLTLTFSQLAGVFVTAITNVTGAGPYEGVPMHIRVKASTAITLRTQAAGTYTTVTYNVEGSIEQVA